MSIPIILRQIRALPYADMMMLASEVAKQISAVKKTQLDAMVMAEILSKLQDSVPNKSEVTARDDKILREAFTRKRTMAISRAGPGYALDISTLPGAQVQGEDIRFLFPMLLDQVVTMHVLKKV